MASKKIMGGGDSQAPLPTTSPPYPEKILAAIEALGEKKGSNKSSIQRQIEASYGPLSPAHSALINHHLNRMKSAGQLHFINNKYLIPDPNAPPRRGRGRPPKSRDTVAPPPPPPPPPPPTASSLSGKKRGRPPKAAAAAVAAAVAVAAKGARRGRGRPPKVKPAVTAD